MLIALMDEIDSLQELVGNVTKEMENLIGNQKKMTAASSSAYFYSRIQESKFNPSIQESKAGGC